MNKTHLLQNYAGFDANWVRLMHQTILKGRLPGETPHESSYLYHKKPERDQLEEQSAMEVFEKRIKRKLHQD